MSSAFDQAKAFFMQGLASYEAGHYEQAETQLNASLALLPRRASTLTNLGATRLKLGKVHEALDLLQDALLLEPDNVEALAHAASALAELGRKQEALEHVSKALALKSQLGPAWSLRGTLLREMGDVQEAILSYELAIANGGNAELNNFYLAALKGSGGPPVAPPRAYVENLFDAYASTFQQHVSGVLGYRAPQVLAEGVRQIKHSAPRLARALDLGCGTGLCAAALRPLVDAIDGVDLSLNMIEQARATGLYAQLTHCDLAEYLQHTEQRYQLIVAADVFIYVGALEAVFAGAARVLAPSGILCFCVEESPQSGGFSLVQSLRYAHSEAYVRARALAQGFEAIALSREPVRQDQQDPIPGLFVWLRKRPNVARLLLDGDVAMRACG